MEPTSHCGRTARRAAAEQPLEPPSPINDVTSHPLPSSQQAKYLKKWRDEGLFEPVPFKAGTYGGVIVALICFSVYMAPNYPVLAGLLVGTCWAHCGFLQHMGGHREMGAISFPWQHFFEGLCKGGSASWWRNRHNKHHAKVSPPPFSNPPTQPLI